ncbi:unnamed protein product, partial [marine sediment metagenome]
MLGVEAIPAIVYTIMVLYVPESPRWLLVNKNDENGARNVLVQLGDQDPENSIRAIYCRDIPE